jgi:hypothetical protein
VVFICLTAIFSSALVGCQEDGDTTKPVITLIEPAEGDLLQVGGASGVHFEAEFSDDEALASYKVNIHPNFDGHAHAHLLATSETVDFEYEKSWEISGRNADIHHHEIRIPETAKPGAYHLQVYCTDAAGNESNLAKNVVLGYEAGDDN